MTHLRFAFVLLVTLAACGDDGSPATDTGAGDSATADSSATDSAVGDSSASDGSPADGSVTDSGSSDAVVSDSGSVDAMTGDGGSALCDTVPVDRMACSAEGTYCPTADGCCTCATVSVCSREPAWYCLSSVNDDACPTDPPAVSDGACPMTGLVCRYCTRRGAIVRECTRRGWVEGSLAICR